ncbi:hypothetical protein [Paenibacillus caui]|uniref:hypothetical protein n=1 Tax=Paenibacillus caui TaxID=2873927 RepID=UPI001CA9F9C0|nr:hypothetical protein [Paenibacillus caui]
MKIYEEKQLEITLESLEQLVPVNMRKHIIEIMTAGPTSRFFCKIEKQFPNIHIYLLEQNQSESYEIGHFFSCNQIDDTYLYLSLPLEQIKSYGRFITQLPNL